MKSIAFAAAAVAAFAVAMAGSAVADAYAAAGDGATSVQHRMYPVNGQTPYGTYQNDHKARSGVR